MPRPPRPISELPTDAAEVVSLGVRIVGADAFGTLRGKRAIADAIGVPLGTFRNYCEGRYLVPPIVLISLRNLAAEKKRKNRTRAA